MITDSWINKSWPNSKARWKYNFQLSNFGFPHIDAIKSWVAENPNNRYFGNMGFISCNSEQDAILVVLKWA